MQTSKSGHRLILLREERGPKGSERRRPRPAAEWPALRVAVAISSMKRRCPGGRAEAQITWRRASRSRIGASCSGGALQQALPRQRQLARHFAQASMSASRFFESDSASAGKSFFKFSG
jgi:hypothetical protein